MKQNAQSSEQRCAKIMRGVDALGFDIPEDVRMRIEDQVFKKEEHPMSVGRFTSEFFSYAGVPASHMAASIVLSVIGYLLQLAGAFFAAYAAAWIFTVATGGTLHIGFLGSFLGNIGTSSFETSFNQLVFAAIAALVVLALHLALTSASSLISHKIAFTALKELRLELFSRLSRIPQGYLIENPIGRVRTLVVDRVGGLEDWIAHTMPELPGRLAVPLASIVILFVVDWRVALAAFVPLPLAVVGMAVMMANYEPRMYLWMATKSSLAGRAAEYIQGIPVIKAFLQEDASFSRFAKSADLYLTTTMSWWKQSWLGMGIMLAAMGSPFLAVVPVAFTLYGAGELGIFGLGLCLTLPLGILQHMYQLMSSFELFQMVIPIWNEIRGLLDYPELDRPGASQRVTIDPRSGIEFKDVHFSYGDKTEALRGVSFTAERGQVTALVGPSGSGKSTIARLIASFWDVGSGSILLGGQDVRNMSLNQLMEEISYVSQDAYLFEGSIRDNIRLGRPDASDEEIVRAAQAARCHDFIMALPRGYDTDAGEAGASLSGGERQRITLARAILKPASFVILDEATAYADPESEAQIQEALSEVVRGRSLLVVAHRLNTIKGASKIVVVDAGHVAATGTHDELIEKSPLYRSLWRRFSGEEL